MYVYVYINNIQSENIIILSVSSDDFLHVRLEIAEHHLVFLIYSIM